MIGHTFRRCTTGPIAHFLDERDRYKDYPTINEFSFLVRQKEFSCLRLKFQWLYAFNPPKCREYLQKEIKRLGLWQKFQDVHSWDT